jgi:hypothetical protein
LQQIADSQLLLTDAILEQNKLMQKHNDLLESLVKELGKQKELKVTGEAIKLVLPERSKREATVENPDGTKTKIVIE